MRLKGTRNFRKNTVSCLFGGLIFKFDAVSQSGFLVVRVSRVSTINPAARGQATPAVTPVGLAVFVPIFLMELCHRKIAIKSHCCILGRELEKETE